MQCKFLKHWIASITGLWNTAEEQCNFSEPASLQGQCQAAAAFAPGLLTFDRLKDCLHTQLPISVCFVVVCFHCEICLPLKYKWLLLLQLLFIWNSPLRFTFTWPFLTLCKHQDFSCFDVCLHFHLYETGDDKKKQTKPKKNILWRLVGLFSF